MKAVLFILLLFVFQGAGAQTTAPSFRTLLDEAAMRHFHPVGFEKLPLEPSVFNYEKRIVHRQQGIEVRYSIRPLDRITIDYEDPHNAAPHPNDLFDMLFRSVVDQLSGGSHSINKAYTSTQSQELFNAGWAAASVFDVATDISVEYKQAMLIAMHKNDLADAYIFILTNDLRKHKPLINQVMKTLLFKEGPVTGKEPEQASSE
jgi:hypothetical protein